MTTQAPTRPRAGMSMKERVARLPAPARRAYFRALSLSTIKEILRDEWWWTSRPEQVPPPGIWLIYLVLSGRGWGKSRAGSEWLVDRTVKHPVDRSGAPTERLVVAETISDARSICLGGPSGILRVLRRRGIRYRYVMSPKPVIRFLDTGCLIHAEGADDADVGRGHNLADAWLDELAKWPNPRGSWIEGIMPALRVDVPGDHPRAFITTTPKPSDLLRDWASRTDGTVLTVQGSTYDNKINLSSTILRALEETYAGTTIGLQELEGVLLDIATGKVFSQVDINTARVEPGEVPELPMIVVGIDPGGTGDEDETGVVVVGRSSTFDQYVLGDHTISGVGREAALHCWRVLAQYGAHRLVVENTLGKNWVTESFTTAYFELREEGLFPENSLPPIDTVDSKLSKKTRAQPVGMRCEQHRIHFVDKLPKLEHQCVEFDPDDRDSPDRLDAFVSASRYLMKQEPRRASLITPTMLGEMLAASPEVGGGLNIMQELEMQLARW